MREIHTEAGLHIGKAIDNLLAHAQTEDCFTTFNDICLPANRLTTKEELWQKYDDAYDDAMAERSRKYEQRREAEQRQRYTAPLRKQIEQLIVDLQTKIDANALVSTPRDIAIGERYGFQYCRDRLRAILSDSDASEAEKGSESSVGEG